MVDVGRLQHENTERRSRSRAEASGAAIADPGPLGLWAFATGTWIAGAAIGGAFPEDAFAMTIPIILIFAGLVQFIAGLIEYRRTNMLAATAFCCFGAFYLTAAFVFPFQAATALASATNPPTLLWGLLLASFGLIALALTVSALRTNVVFALVFGTLAAGFMLTSIPVLMDVIDLTKLAFASELPRIGSWFVIASAAFAYYMGLALVVNRSWQQPVFPIGGQFC